MLEIQYSLVQVTHHLKAPYKLASPKPPLPKQPKPFQLQHQKGTRSSSTSSNGSKPKIQKKITGRNGKKINIEKLSLKPTKDDSEDDNSDDDMDYN